MSALSQIFHSKKQVSSSETTSFYMKPWIDSASFEMTAAETETFEKIKDRFNPGTKISIVHLPEKDYRKNIEFARVIHEAGLVAVPHLAARLTKDKEELKNILSELRKVGVNEMLLLGGGLEIQNGEFETVYDMLTTGYFEEEGFRSIGVAGHPEPHPFATEENIWKHYEQKYRYLTDKKFDFSMYTQFTFSPQSALDFSMKLYSKGFHYPTLVGVVGVCNFPSLIKYALICGIGNSIKILKKEASNLNNLSKGYRTENFLVPFSQALSENKSEETAYQAMFQGIHVFPFGNLIKTLDYFDRLN